jgi:hypothetical protein
LQAEPLIPLLVTAAFIGSVHTLLGPDHYLPFIAMGHAWKWTRAKTLAVTLGCGVAHVLSSVVLGVAGVGFGVSITKLLHIESARGEWATWGLIAFGLIYAAWGWIRARRGKEHSHFHVHANGTGHKHEHDHHIEHMHVHSASEGAGVARATPWVLFTIFVFGPCEPLIPLLMVPAARHSVGGVALVTAVFGVTTLLTMSAAVWVCLAGAERIRFGWMERYAHALAGGALVACGAAVQFLGV